MAHQHRSARRFAKPSPLFRWARDRGMLTPPGRAVVIGAGHLVEAEELRALGWRVDALETSESVARRPDVYDAFARSPGGRVLTSPQEMRARYGLALVTHVVEFVEDPDERRELLASVAARLTVEGRLLISMRGWSDVRASKNAQPRGDGIVTGIGTWTRGFSVAEAKELLDAAGLEVIHSPHPRSTTPEQVRLVCRRQKSSETTRSSRSRTRAER